MVSTYAEVDNDVSRDVDHFLFWCENTAVDRIYNNSSHC